MGTKRHMVHRVKDLISEQRTSGKVIDLFSGVGAVAESLVDQRSVITNDALAFTAALSRARFLSGQRSMNPGDAIAALRTEYRAHFSHLMREHREAVREEQLALSHGKESIARYMGQTQHVANSEDVAEVAARASLRNDRDRYCMTTLYFSAGYFGFRQSMQLDALRYSIDTVAGDDAGDRDWMIAAWLQTAAAVINAPGHTAQFLKPNTDSAGNRIRRYWLRDIWRDFQDKLIDLKPVGTEAWRQGNQAIVAEAIALLEAAELKDVGIVYADPPYTKDQYSRFYHVYETLYLYDFPTSSGEGRARTDRFSTGFSLKSDVKNSFIRLFDAVAELELPLILSYPSEGLLARTDTTVEELIRRRFTLDRVETLSAEHSTMGGSKGFRTKSAMENLYVCTPN